RRTVAEHVAHLGVHPPLDVGVLREEEERVRQRERRRLVAGEEERDALVAQLLVVHARAVLVGRSEQPAEQIVARVRALAAAVDDAEEQCVDALVGACELAVRGRLHPDRDPEEHLRLRAKYSLKTCTDSRTVVASLLSSPAPKSTSATTSIVRRESSSCRF